MSNEVEGVELIPASAVETSKATGKRKSRVSGVELFALPADPVPCAFCEKDVPAYDQRIVRNRLKDNDLAQSLVFGLDEMVCKECSGRFEIEPEDSMAIRMLTFHYFESLSKHFNKTFGLAGENYKKGNGLCM